MTLPIYIPTNSAQVLCFFYISHQHLLFFFNLFLVVAILTSVYHNRLWKILRGGTTRPPDLPPENLYAGQEATVRIGHETTDWCQIGKGVRQGCILSPCLFNFYAEFSSVQFSTWSCPTLCDPMDCSMPGFSVHHQLLDLAQMHVRQVGNVIQPSHPLLSLSPPAFNLSQHQGLCQ